MKKISLTIGGLYTADLGGQPATVRLEAIRTKRTAPNQSMNVYDVVDPVTGRKATFSSATRFYAEVKPKQQLLPTMQPTGFAARVKAVKPVNMDTAPHLIVTARAGTGKTTSLIEGVKLVMGLNTELTPSPQQRAIWDSMMLSRRTARSICFAAFGKDIANTLKDRVPPGCDASTLHGLGFKAVNRAFQLPERNGVDKWRVNGITAKLCNTTVHDLKKRRPVVLTAVDELVGLCKQTLTEVTEDNLLKLARHYEVELDVYAEPVLELVPKVLEWCKTKVSEDQCIDYNDMVWLPIVLDLPVYRYDLLLGDEVQDWNRAQQSLAMRAGHRLILCGDPKQAIFGFAGADSQSMSRMALLLDNQRVDRQLGDPELNGRGCEGLPLTVTRRCGKAIVKEAQRLVPDFEAHEDNGPGCIIYAAYDDKAKGLPQYRTLVNDDDMVLCRLNAPLVSQVFKFLKEGRKANILGRNIGDGLVRIIKKMDAVDIPDLLTKLVEWRRLELEKEAAAAKPDEDKMIRIQDTYDCLYAFCEDMKTVPEVIKRIDAVFADSTDGIRLSSIHKAKGLEAKRVHLLQPKGAAIPHKMAKSAWQIEQEYNLLYVAITRAIEDLVYVS